MIAKVTEIEKEIIKLKHEVKEFMDDNYVEFVPRLKKDQALAKEAEQIINELKSLQKRVDDQVQQKLFSNMYLLWKIFDQKC